MSDFREFVDFIRSLYGGRDKIPLHEPRFSQRERENVLAAIDSTFVSSVGAFVGEFERRVAMFTGAGHAIATVNGTAALHVALLLAGVKPGDLVITQPLTFVATANAIRYCGADPVFVDVDADTLGLSPASLQQFIDRECTPNGEGLIHRASGRRVATCLPMHTLGHPVRIDLIVDICLDAGITLVEDAAEALGSYYQGRHVGTFGRLGVLSFNGNKTITTGGGGMILTNDSALSAQALHLTTTAKKPHRWLYEHDQTGFNYRLPNLNAALGCGQMEALPVLLADKRAVAAEYQAWCGAHGFDFIAEPKGSRSNYWLNGIRLADAVQRDAFLKHTNDCGVMTRPLWMPLHQLPMYSQCPKADLSNAERLFAQVVNIPSSARS
jgi:aminotransferase in exopolysaccharide biosynthesis